MAPMSLLARFLSETCEWRNENLYIAHKKLPHKALRVHSTRYTQCIHASSHKLKLPKDAHTKKYKQLLPTHRFPKVELYIAVNDNRKRQKKRKKSHTLTIVHRLTELSQKHWTHARNLNTKHNNFVPKGSNSSDHTSTMRTVDLSLQSSLVACPLLKTALGSHLHRKLSAIAAHLFGLMVAHASHPPAHPPTHTHTHIHTCIHIHTYPPIHTHTHTCAHTHTHVHTHTHACKHSHAHAHTHTHKHTQNAVQTHTYTHTCIQNATGHRQRRGGQTKAVCHWPHSEPTWRRSTATTAGWGSPESPSPGSPECTGWGEALEQSPPPSSNYHQSIFTFHYKIATLHQKRVDMQPPPPSSNHCQSIFAFHYEYDSHTESKESGYATTTIITQPPPEHLW